MNLPVFEPAARLRHDHHYQEKSGIGIYTFPAFSSLRMVRHGFTARMGGVSKGGYHSLNLSFTRPDEKKETVMENYRLFCAAAQIHFDRMVMDTFEHGVNVIAVDETHCGSGYLAPPLPFCDGLITNTPGITLITGHADCLPLYFVDPVSRSIGLAHAGWKGTLHKIGTNVIQKMADLYGANPANMYAGIGPCICQNCFEVDEELAHRFADAYPGVPLAKPGKPGKAFLDLALACAVQFLSAGILPERITLMDVCTYENSEHMYSYRRDKGYTGGMAAFLQLCPGETDAFCYMPTAPSLQ